MQAIAFIDILNNDYQHFTVVVIMAFGALHWAIIWLAYKPR